MNRLESIKEQEITRIGRVVEVGQLNWFPSSDVQFLLSIIKESKEENKMILQRLERYETALQYIADVSLDKRCLKAAEEALKEP